MTLVSVVMPAHDAEAYLEGAIRSALAQTHHQVEVVVVDDGSTDATHELAERLAREDDRVVPVRRTRRGGPAAARNIGLEAARGDYVSFLDADDLYRPDKTARHLTYLAGHPEVGVVFSDHEVVDADLTPLRVRRRGLPDGEFLDSLLLHNWFHIGAALTRREVLDRVGGFNERVVSGEDWDLWIRIARRERIAYLPGIVLSYRSRPGQRKRDLALKRRGWPSLLDQQRSLRRRQRRRLRTGVHWARAQFEWDMGSRPRAVLALGRLALTARRPRRIAEVRRLSAYASTSSERAKRS